VSFIQDLQGVSATDFNSELASWTSDSGALTGNFHKILLQSFILFTSQNTWTQVQRIYPDIDDHSYIAFSLEVYMYNSCTGNILQMSFDDIQTNILAGNSVSFHTYQSFNIKGGVPHSGSALEAKITSQVNTLCPSFTVGVRELNMNFMKNFKSTEQQFCHTLLTKTQLTTICACGLDQRGSDCKTCNTGCTACGMVSETETCSNCDAASLLEWDGEACSTCGSHCDKCEGFMGDDCRSCLNGHFIYGNGSCIEGCPSPMKRVSSGDLVQNCIRPCEESEWLYVDLSCQDYCNFKEETDKNGVRWCKSPCEDEDDYYYENKGVCKGSCEYPNEAEDIEGVKICSLALDEGEAKQIKGMSKGVNGANTGSAGAILALSFLSSSDSSLIFMGAFSKMLQYIKYIDIAYPVKVELMLEMLNSNSSESGGFASRIMRKVLNRFPDRELPPNFEYYGAVSSFFVNFWPSLFILLILLSATSLFMLLNLCARKTSKIKQILNQVTGILKWNMILLLFCGDFGDLVFFTALEVTTADPSTFESSLSLLICIVINIFAIWVLVQILTMNFNIRKAKELSAQDIDIKWGSYKTFFAIYKDQSYLQQIFMFIFLIRVSIFNAVIGYLFNFPFAQVILITLVNLCMLLYLVFRRPMKALINFIQQVVLEGFLFIFNVCICILAGLDHNGVEAYEFRDHVGEVIVVINLIVPIVSIVILGAKFLILGIEAYKGWKAEKAKKKKALGKDIRVEKPRKQRIGDPIVVHNNGELESSMANRVLDMSSSDVSFVNNSDAWINNERNRRLNYSSRDFWISIFH